MALTDFERAVISTLQLHNSALILLLERVKFDRKEMGGDLRVQGEMLFAIQEGVADLEALFSDTSPGEGT